MSAEALRTTASEVRPTRERSLRAVEAPQALRRPRVRYGVMAVIGAVAIGGAQMALSILTTQSGYELADLNAQNRELTFQQQILSDDVAGLSSPQFLAANASALGMVTGQQPSYLRLSDATIVGGGGAASEASSVDAGGRVSISNAVIGGSSLTTAPEETIDDGAVVDTSAVLNSPTPPPIADGLPTPTTH